MSSAGCPDEAAIVAFARGESGATRDAIEHHLEGCEACCALVAVAAAAFEDELRTVPDYGSATVDVPGPAFGRYVLSRPIGRGGMGVVYLAHDPQLKREIAIKLLHYEAVGPERLLREAQAMAQLSHPNVVTVHDVGEHTGRVFIAMEYVNGVTLRRWLSAAPRSWREVVDVFIAAGRGLAAAHTARLIHRDFKPDNVLLGVDGRILVTDFGLARPLGLADEGTLVSRMIGASGTPPYMSPEQLAGQAIDTRTDQYSYCVALYEALNGVRPFDGTTPDEVATNIRAGVKPSPSGRAVPRWLQDIVRKGLDVVPEHRYPSMDALLAALQRPASSARRSFGIAAASVAAIAMVVLVIELTSGGSPPAAALPAPIAIPTGPSAVAQPVHESAQAAAPEPAPTLAPPTPRPVRPIARHPRPGAQHLDDSLRTPQFAK